MMTEYRQSNRHATSNLRICAGFRRFLAAAHWLLYARSGIFRWEVGDYSRPAALSSPNFSTRYRI
jgi:hypothetical protein